jgi:hypothetical protein
VVKGYTNKLWCGAHDLGCLIRVAPGRAKDLMYKLLKSLHQLSPPRQGEFDVRHLLRHKSNSYEAVKQS